MISTSIPGCPNGIFILSGIGEFMTDEYESHFGEYPHDFVDDEFDDATETLYETLYFEEDETLGIFPDLKSAQEAAKTFSMLQIAIQQYVKFGDPQAQNIWIRQAESWIEVVKDRQYQEIKEDDNDLLSLN